MARADKDDAGGDKNPDTLREQRKEEQGAPQAPVTQAVLPPPQMSPSASYTTNGTASTGPSSAVSYANPAQAAMGSMAQGAAQVDNSSDPRWQRLYADAIRQQVASGSTASVEAIKQAAKDAATNAFKDPNADNRTAGQDYATDIASGKSNAIPDVYKKTGTSSTGSSQSDIISALGGSGIGANALKSLTDHYSMIYSQIASKIAQTGTIWELDGIDPDTRLPKLRDTGTPSEGSKLSAAQIAKLTAETAVQQSLATGKFQDPVTGLWQDLPDTVLKKAQANLANYTASKTEAEKEYIKGAQTNLTNAETAYKNQQTADLQQRLTLDKQNALAQAVADPRRSVEAAMMMQLYGPNALQGMQGQAVQGSGLGSGVASGFVGAQGAQGMGAQGMGAQGMGAQGMGASIQGYDTPGAKTPGATNNGQPLGEVNAVAPGFVGKAPLGPVQKAPGAPAAPTGPYVGPNMAQYEAWRANTAGAPAQAGDAQTQLAVMPGQVRAAVMPGGEGDQRAYIGGSANFDENTGTYRTQGAQGAQAQEAQALGARTQGAQGYGTLGAQGVQAQGAQVAPGFVGGDAAYGAGGYSADQLAQARAGTPYAVNANLNAALSGQYVPSSGLKSGGTSAVTSIAGAKPNFGSYGKINPVNYRNMSADTQGRYESLALANEGMTRDDLQRQSKLALPGASIGR